MVDDEYGTCPYNSEHRIVRFRLPAHMIKCRKNYHGPPLDQCIYNATHLVPVGTMNEHLETCIDCHRFNNTKYNKIADSFYKRN